MRKRLNLCAIVLSVFFLFFAQAVAFADHPGSVVLDDKITTPNFSYDVLYTDDATSSSIFSAANAQNVADALDTSVTTDIAFPGYHQLYLNMGFNAPFFSTDPKSVHIWDCGCAFANAPEALINIDSPATNSKNEMCHRKLAGHELFHHVQYSYIKFSEWPAWGTWVIEGTVKSMEDKVYSDIDNGDTTIPNCSSYYSRLTEYIDNTEDTLWDFSYPVALFWTYLTEQLGTNSTEPQIGTDFMLRFWELAEDEDPDGIGILRETISEFSPGRTIEDLFHDFIIANYSKDLNLSGVADAGKFQYIDDDSPANSYPTVTTINATIDTEQSDNVVRWGVKYYEQTIPNNCTIAGFSSDGDFAVYGLLVSRADGTVSHLFQSRGTNFAKAIINDAANPITKLTAVVGALEDDANFDYIFGCGDAKMVIKDPTMSNVAFVGEPDQPERFLVKLVVTGPESLGEPTVRGLSPADFEVFGGDVEPENSADVISGAYVQGEYWLVVQAPEKTEDQLDNSGDMIGDFDINVVLGPISADERDAILYSTVRRDQVVVIDKSGSMGSPAGSTKLNAAKNGASLFVDAASDEDKLGIICFSGDNDDETDDDAKVIHNLQDVLGKRQTVKDSIDDIETDNMTSIGDGLSLAKSELELNGDPENNEQFIILLSDGEQNEPFFWGEAPDIKPTIVSSGIKVHTIALGPETDQELMQDIADSTGGNYYYVDVGELGVDATDFSRVRQLAISAEELPNRLSDTFKLIDESILRHERLWFEEGSIFENSSDNHKIEVDEDQVEEAIFAFNWTGDIKELVIKLTRPDGSIVNSGDPGVSFFNDSNHLVIQMDKLQNGTWEVELSSQQGTASYVASLSAKIINGVKFDLYFAQLTTDDDVIENNGLFVRGLPMPIFGILTDRKGFIRGAGVDVSIEAPDGNISKLTLFDDGNHNDGEVEDGVYGNVYTRTTLGSQGGVIENTDSQATRGSYIVKGTAEGESNFGTKFMRLKSKSFHIFEFDTTRTKKPDPDPDGDGMPSRWEEMFGLSVTQDDSKKDKDNDGLLNIEEFAFGTKPNDPDTDNGGESDLSEVKRGANALDPEDDRIPTPIDVGIIHVDSHPLPVEPKPNSNLIHFPINSAYKSLLLLRTTDLDDDFELVTQIDPKEFRGITFDEGLINNVTYFYQIVALGFNGELSAPSHTFSGTPKADPIPPFSSGFIINNDDLVTDSIDVTLNIDTSSDASEMRVSNNASFSDTKWEPIISTKSWKLDPDPATNLAFVFLQIRDKSLNESEIYGMGITVDPEKVDMTPTPTPVPVSTPVTMVLDSSKIEIAINETRSIKVQLFDSKGSTVPNWPVNGESSSLGVVGLDSEFVNSDNEGIALFTVKGVSSGDASIVFTAEPGLKQALDVTVTTEVLPTPTISPLPSPGITPFPIKSFTFGCERNLIKGVGGFDRLIMDTGDKESCLLTLTNLEPGITLEVVTNLKSGPNRSIEIDPVIGKTDNNGELNVTIRAIGKGIDWVAWGVPNDKGVIEFNKKAYGNGTSWGMFVEVK